MCMVKKIKSYLSVGEASLTLVILCFVNERYLYVIIPFLVSERSSLSVMRAT